MGATSRAGSTERRLVAVRRLGPGARQSKSIGVEREWAVGGAGSSPNEGRGSALEVGAAPGIRKGGLPVVPESTVLILTLTSKTQVRGGDGAYLAENGMALRLHKHGDQLMRARERIWESMTQADERWCGATIAELAENDCLRKGEDFGGHDQGALYRPAVDRYEGRFYTALGPTGRELLRTPRHHLLLLSHVYGLVWPTECIQLHSCPIRDELGVRVPWVYDIWRADNLLTSLLRHYIQAYGIRLLLDLTADPDFRYLVRLDKLSQKKGLEIRRGWGTRSAGVDSLPAFGHLTRALLSMPDDELRRIPPGRGEDGVCEEVLLMLLAEEPPPQVLLRPQWDTRDLRDHIRRARDGVIRLVNLLDGRSSRWDDRGLCARIQAVEARGDITPDEARCMRELLDLRNLVDHEGYRDGEHAARPYREGCRVLVNLARRKDLGEIDELSPGQSSE